MKKIIVSFFAGILVAFSIMILLQPKPDPDKKPYITPISGTPAIIRSTNRDKDEIHYIIDYTAPGSSALNIPVDSIPEAYVWRHYHWSKTFMYSTDGTLTALIGYRYERMIFQGGVFARAPALAARFHLQTQTNLDAGLVFGMTYLSESPLF